MMNQPMGLAKMKNKMMGKAMPKMNAKDEMEPVNNPVEEGMEIPAMPAKPAPKAKKIKVNSLASLKALIKSKGM